jgi:hypothetical protein
MLQLCFAKKKLATKQGIGLDASTADHPIQTVAFAPAYFGTFALKPQAGEASSVPHAARRELAAPRARTTEGTRAPVRTVLDKENEASSCCCLLYVVVVVVVRCFLLPAR